MALTKYKIGDLVTLVDERNNLGIRDFYGININKEFMLTVANTEGLDETKYKVVKKNRFVYSGMQTGRDESIRVGMYNNDNTILVSPAYITFEVTAQDVVLPLYFFMKFLSKEKDRYGAFCSDGSIRSNLDWEVFCEIEIDLPPLEIQQKYVDIYKAMVKNQQVYERGLDDLKLSCEGLINEYKHKSQKIYIANILEEVDYRNTENTITDVQGINIQKQFMPTVADMNNVNLLKYKVVKKGQFAFSGMQTGRDECIRIALHNKENPITISPAYSVFEIKDKSILPEYIMMWFSRKEIDRLGWFMSDASIRTNLDLERFYEIEIPIPEMRVQKSIVEIYNAYKQRKMINEKLKSQIKDICPILIKGAVKETERMYENVQAAV